MKKDDKDLHLEKLKGGLDEKDRLLIDGFFYQLSEQIDLPIVFRSQLIQHFINGFEYYLEQGMKVSDICKLLEVSNLGSFYLEKSRTSYSLDNAAIVYPLGMRYGQMPMFRLSAELKEEVEPSLLQLALDFTIKRFPTFSAIIKNGFFWHYLESVNTVYLVEEEKDIPCKPISIILRSYRSFRVLYYRKRISVEFFHVPTDGSGGMVFLKTLLAEYLRLKGKAIPKEKGVLDINEEVREGELVNEFKKAEGDASLSTFVDKKSLQIDGKLSNVNMTRIVHFIMDSDKLNQVSKSYGGTVTAYITSLLFMAAKKCISRKEGLFNIQIPINMRKFNGSNTLRNYSMYFNASMDIKDIHDLKDLVPEMGKQIVEKGSQETMNQMMMTTGKLIDSLSFVPLFLKVPIMQHIYGYLSNSIIGCTLSNLGKVDMPEKMAGEVEKLYFLMAPGRPNRITSTMVTINGKCVFTIVRNSDDPRYEQEIYELLKKEKLITSVEGSVEYES